MSIQDDVDAFLAVVEPFLDVYSLADVAFLAIKANQKTTLFSARVVLHIPHPGVRRLRLDFESEHLVAKRDLISVSRKDIDTLVGAFASGVLELGNVHQELANSEGVGLYTSASLFNQPSPPGTARTPSLRIHTATRHELLTAVGGTDSLDWELRAASPPFESLDELMMSSDLLSPQRMGDMCSIELVAATPAIIAADSAITAGKATIHVIAAKDLTVHELRLGYRVPKDGRMERGVIPGSALTWRDDGDLQKGSCEVAVADAPNLQAFLSYRGTALHQWWAADPSRLINARLAAHYAVDPDLKVLRELLLTPENGYKFESAVSLLAFVCGFSPAHYGVAPRLREFADLTLATPSNRIAVVECTIGLPGIKDKLAKLKQRVLKVQQQLETAGLQHLEVVPIIVTACRRDEVAVDEQVAAQHRIAMIAREDIENLLQRLSYISNAEALFDEVKTLIPQLHAEAT